MKMTLVDPRGCNLADSGGWNLQNLVWRSDHLSLVACFVLSANLVLSSLHMLYLAEFAGVAHQSPAILCSFCWAVCKFVRALNDLIYDVTPPHFNLVRLMIAKGRDISHRGVDRVTSLRGL
jgi:hypothetical protein